MVDSIFANEGNQNQQISPNPIPVNNDVQPPVKKHKFLMPLLTILAVILFAGGTGFGVWYWQHNELNKQNADNNTRIAALQKQIDDLKKEETTTKPTETNLTNDQIFQEVSSQFGFTRNQLSSFKIHKDGDRVEYHGTEERNSVWGAHFAYKDGATWKEVPGDSGLSLSDCSTLNNVPEKYRTGCEVGTTGQTLYTNAQNQFTNYLPSDMTPYIGQ